MDTIKKPYLLAFNDDPGALGMSVLELSDTEAEAPEYLLMARYGSNGYVKGIQRASFSFTEEDADRVIEFHDSRKNDIVIDYNHATLRQTEAPASGWADKLVKKADGLYAHVKSWTGKALEAIKATEYRYHSPVFKFDSNGTVQRVHSVGLTNNPGLDNLPALSLDADGHIFETKQETKQEPMTMDYTEIMKAMGIEPDTLKLNDLTDDAKKEAVLAAIEAHVSAAAMVNAAVQATLTLHDVETLDALNVKIAGMVPEADKKALEAKIAERDAKEAVGLALTDGKITEAQKETALTMALNDLDGFKAFVKGAVAVPTSTPKNLDRKNDRTGDEQTVALSDSEIEIYSNLGMLDEIKKEKK